MKALDIILIEMVLSVIPVVQSMGIFFIWGRKFSCEPCVRSATWLSCFEACPENGSYHARWNGLNMTDLCERKNWRTQNRLDVTTRFWWTFEKINKWWKYGNSHEIWYDESKYFSIIQWWQFQTKFHSVASCLAKTGISLFLSVISLKV